MARSDDDPRSSSVRPAEIDHAAARALASEHLNRPDPGWPDRSVLVILDEHTIEKPYGWVFFYQSQRFLETRDFSDGLAGNAPLLVTRAGELHDLGTAYPVEIYLQEYERSGSPYPR